MPSLAEEFKVNNFDSIHTGRLNIGIEEVWTGGEHVLFYPWFQIQL